MAFEQNQQDQFNMNNGIDQVKQFQAELDKATASIGAAELAAEEEQLGLKLKNLETLQKAKVSQLDQLIAMEEAGIQELARLKLTLSNRQFAIRKKEIQREFQLAKKVAEELYRVESKRKKAQSGSKKATNAPNDISALTKGKATKAAVKESTNAVQSELLKLLRELDKTLVSLQGTMTTYGNQQKEALVSAVNQPTQQSATEKQQLNNLLASLQTYLEAQGKLNNTTSTDLTNKLLSSTKANEPNNTTTASTTDTTKQEITGAPKEPQYSDSSKGLEEVDLETNSPAAIREGFEGLLAYLNSSRKLTKEQSTDPSLLATARLNKTITKDLNSVTAAGNTASQTSLELAGDLIKEINAANDAEAKLKEFTAKKDLNTRLVFAKKEHELREALFKKELEQAESRAKLEADIAWTAANRDSLIARKEEEAKQGYLQEYQALQLDSWTHLTENMSQAEFAALRAETAATEEAIAARSKIAEASEKTLATLRSKGTLKEKKQLLEAQIKERAAQKDWSKAGEQFQMKEITDKMSEEEKEAARKQNEEAQKNREKAAALEMAATAALSKMADLAQQLNNKADSIAGMQGFIDTRLQGSKVNELYNLSYGKQLMNEAKWIAGASPYIRQEKLVDNIKALVDKGISFDVKQRAFLMTIQEKIANTFNVADGTLLRLIRIQQQDTTAGRLGMESALNSFLNSMYETSEYLESVAGNVRASLEEMQSLMEGRAATEIEYQVQKWMGSLHSVGMSDSAVQDIAKTFGQIASGDVGGLTGSGTGNLLIMAANEAGISIADILQKGLDADETNELMQAMVNYLAEIAETSNDSRVVQQQLANVYGLKASDLKAATNLASSVKDVYKTDMSYGGMIGQLNQMMNTIGLRTSIGEGMSNMWDNIMYSMASTQATNPMLYLLPKVATLLEDYAGGIDLPFVNVMGFGVDLNTSVAQLMNVAAVSGSILGSIGPVLAGLSDLVNPLAGTTMMIRAGINPLGKTPVLARGSAPVLQNLGGSSISESGLIGNASSEDVKKATLQDAEDSKKKQMVEAKDAESSEDVVIRSQQAIIDIYNLLEEVAHGSQSLRVRLVNSSGGAVAFGSNESTETSPTTPNVGINSGDNGNWVLSF